MVQSDSPASSLEARETPSDSSRSSSPASTSTCGTTASLDSAQEFNLLTLDVALENATDGHEVITAPLLTRGAYVSAGLTEKGSQYGVLGNVIAIRENGNHYVPDDPRLYINTNAPFSAIVCGVQGSGKSHTVSVLLENMLISGYPPIGLSHKALSGLVLHFGEGGAGTRPCEAASVGCSAFAGVDPPAVKVYVSQSSLSTMRKVYAPFGKTVTVEALMLSETELDAEAIMSLMAVGNSESAPLYMHRILTILRSLGEKFTYSKFLSRIERAKADLSPSQLVGLEQRMVLLQTLIDGTVKNAKPRFRAGQLTIIDLSDPFIDPASACALFEIATRLFVRADVDSGKVLVVDEAHKYLSVNRGMTGLTKALTAMTRQQRHLAIRVIISTQEPTALPPVLIDLCSVAVLHRFSSPAWWEAIVKHVSADFSSAEDDAFDHVVRLKTGEAVILAPSGLGVFPTGDKAFAGAPELAHFGRRYLLARTRRRITADGGASRMVVSA